MFIIYILLPIVLLIINLYLYIMYKRKNSNKYSVLHSLNNYFTRRYIYFDALSQRITVYEGNDYIYTLFGCISLKNDYCLFQYLINPKEEHIIITGILKIDWLNFFCIKGKSNYFQLKYLQKRIYKDRKIYGLFDTELIKFSTKYNFNRFYISTIPNKLKEVEEYPSIIYLSIPYKEFKDSIIKELFSIIEQLSSTRPSENIEKYNNDAIKLYEQNVYKEITKKRQSKIEERVLRERQSMHIEEKQNTKKKPMIKTIRAKR